eukprot:2358387-Amphidinium_carterae.1
MVCLAPTLLRGNFHARPALVLACFPPMFGIVRQWRRSQQLVPAAHKSAAFWGVGHHGTAKFAIRVQCANDEFVLQGSSTTKVMVPAALALGSMTIAC